MTSPATAKVEMFGPYKVFSTQRRIAVYLADDGTEVRQGFSPLFQREADRMAEAHGGHVEVEHYWSVGRMIDGAWNGQLCARREEAVTLAEKWLASAT